MAAAEMMGIAKQGVSILQLLWHTTVVTQNNMSGRAAGAAGSGSTGVILHGWCLSRLEFTVEASQLHVCLAAVVPPQATRGISVYVLFGATCRLRGR